MAKRMGQTRPISAVNLESVPEQSGVYHLIDRRGEIIYTGSVGAGRLRARLREHPNNRDIAGVRKFQILPLSSTAEARRVEQALIKRHKLKGNTGRRPD